MIKSFIYIWNVLRRLEFSWIEDFHTKSPANEKTGAGLTVSRGLVYEHTASQLDIKYTP